MLFSRLALARLAWIALGCLPLFACQNNAGGHGNATGGGEWAPVTGSSLTLAGGARLTPGEYLLEPLGPEGRDGVVVIEGARGETLDLTGVEIRGVPTGTDLDRCFGYGLVLRDCQDLVVRGGTLGGYRACVVLENCRNVTLEGMHFEGWYGQRLLSTVASEDTQDWLRPHDNDANEWVQNYGAAISATDCSRLTLRDCSGRQGQNGILLTATSESEIYDCDFSFLSGWGLALYRSSNNRISHNIFDYCVRGYSHGVYWRGQDSAGILMFERCNDNVVAFNSATHGGNGIFLYGGQDLVEGHAAQRGEGEDPGGSDRNLFYGNDLRFAVANSLEATFSRDNAVINNQLSGSHQHGVWGGYSSRMVIIDNTFEGTLGGALTIEHGQDCLVGWNRFVDNDIAVELYWDQDPEIVLESNFGQTRDTSSRDHWVLFNRFEGNDQDLVLRETTGVSLSGNRFAGDARPYLVDVKAVDREIVDDETILSWLAGRDGNLPSGNIVLTSLRPWSGEPPELVSMHEMVPPAMPGKQKVVADDRDQAKGGLETIAMGEWGPWDFRSGAPKPFQRRPGGLLSETRWDARWFKWDLATQDPRGDLEAWRSLADEPLVSAVVENWVNPWGSDHVRRTVGDSHFGLRAIATVQLPKGGGYRLSVQSDDGVRVIVDGLDVIEDWSWHAPRRAETRLDLAAGNHLIELEYFQIDGSSALGIELLAVEE